MMRFLLALFLALVALPATAQVTATSPDGRIRVIVASDREGHPTYAVTRGDTVVVAPSRLGFLFTDAPQFYRNVAVTEVARASADTRWEQPWGEWRTVRDHHNELRVALTETSGLKRRIEVVFRLFDDGIGFRYEFPAAFKTVNIAEELTQFAFPRDAAAWWAEAFESNREEYLVNATPIAEVGTAQTPMTLRLTDGTHVALHEAALVDYSGMNVAKVSGGLMKAVLTPSSQGAKVSRAAPFPTPWRVLLIAPDAPSLYAANPLILNLNAPNALGDVSWVKPRRYVGIWWGMHLDTQSWASGPKHGATTANTMKMIDFAAANGFGGVLVEGWNIGWDGDWFANGWDFDFAKPYPDYDLPRLAAYAKRKGVVLIGHHETSANIANYEAQLGKGLDAAAAAGIDTIKTGYVSDAGGVQARRADGGIAFEWHEGQAMARHHLLVVTEAAKRRIAINAHEPIKDTGLRRTYPNWISREGQRGMEYNAWAVPKNPPEHEANLVFTRMLAGPMDFTPGIVSLTGRGGTPLLSTLAKQLATYVVLYSPIQMAADLPENYAKYPEAFAFIRRVPVDWSDTRMLSGAIGDHAVIARRDRAGDDWYLGAVGDEQARRVEVTLDFLDAGRAYTATIWRDGEGADYRTEARHAMTVETRTVRRGDRMTIAMAPGGGQAIRFTPAAR